MRHLAFALLLVACGCSSPEAQPVSSPQSPSPSVTGIRDVADLEKMNGKHVTLDGIFDHIDGKIGVLTLDGGVRVYIPHFDTFRMGDDWFKYVGKRCSA